MKFRRSKISLETGMITTTTSTTVTIRAFSSMGICIVLFRETSHQAHQKMTEKSEENKNCSDTHYKRQENILTTMYVNTTTHDSCTWKQNLGFFSGSTPPLPNGPSITGRRAPTPGTHLQRAIAGHPTIDFVEGNKYMSDSRRRRSTESQRTV